MSFNKQKDFQDAAEQAEKDFFAQYPQKGTDEPTQDTPGEEASTPAAEPIQPEATPEPEAQPVTQSQTDDERYKAAVKAMNEAQRKAAEATKREEEFMRKQAEMEERLNEALEMARQAQTRQNQPQVEEEDSLENDMPEVAKLAERKAKGLMTPLEKRLEDMERRLKAEETIRLRLESDSKAKNMLTEIKAVHPDYDEVVNSEEMVAWINNEAPPIYKAIFDGSIAFQPKDAIAVLNAYKSITTPKSAPKTNTLSAAEIAAPVRTNPNINPKHTPDRELTAKDYDYFMHNSHRMKPEELAEWDRRLNA